MGLGRSPTGRSDPGSPAPDHRLSPRSGPRISGKAGERTLAAPFVLLVLPDLRIGNGATAESPTAEPLASPASGPAVGLVPSRRLREPDSSVPPAIVALVCGLVVLLAAALALFCAPSAEIGT
jgi:hypothetical protein